MTVEELKRPSDSLSVPAGHLQNVYLLSPAQGRALGVPTEWVEVQGARGRAPARASCWVWGWLSIVMPGQLHAALICFACSSPLPPLKPTSTTIMTDKQLCFGWPPKLGCGKWPRPSLELCQGASVMVMDFKKDRNNDFEKLFIHRTLRD